jgi:hypothetical protein
MKKNPKKFKIGDHVITTREFRHGCYFTKGLKGKIKSLGIEVHGVYIDTASWPGVWYIPEKHLKKVGKK